MKTISAKLYPTPTQEQLMLQFLNVARNIIRRATPETHGERCLHEGRSSSREGPLIAETR